MKTFHQCKDFERMEVMITVETTVDKIWERITTITREVQAGQIIVAAVHIQWRSLGLDNNSLNEVGNLPTPYTMDKSRRQADSSSKRNFKDNATDQ